MLTKIKNTLINAAILLLLCSTAFLAPAEESVKPVASTAK